MSLIQKMLVVLVISLVIAFIAKSQAQTPTPVIPSQGVVAKVGQLSIADPYTRSTVPGQKNAGGFLSIQNGGEIDKLISASSAVSETVEIHEMKMEGNVMQMRAMKSLDVPSKGKVDLRPGGYHLMFINLKAPLQVGDKVDVQLTFEKAGKVTIKLPVQDMRAMHGGSHGRGQGR